MTVEMRCTNHTWIHTTTNQRPHQIKFQTFPVRSKGMARRKKFEYSLQQEDLNKMQRTIPHNQDLIPSNILVIDFKTMEYYRYFSCNTPHPLWRKQCLWFQLFNLHLIWSMVKRNGNYQRLSFTRKERNLETRISSTMERILKAEMETCQKP